MAETGSSEQQPNHPFGSLVQYRIVVDELKAIKPTRLEDEAYDRLLALNFELPFQFPWPDNPQSTLMEDRFITYRFRKERRAIELDSGFRTNYFVTSVTSAVPANRFPNLDPNSLSDIFDWILDDLNGLLIAYTIVTKDGDIYPLSLPMLGQCAVWGFIEPYALRATADGIFLLNPLNVPYEKETAPHPVIKEVVKLKFVSETSGYPFLASWQLRLEAEQQLRKGHYHVAAILIGSAFEARTNELLRYWYWKDGKTEAEAMDLLSDVPFVRRLRKEFHPRIGGTFDLNVPGPIRHWYLRTHRLRNLVIHGGHRPSRDETTHSLVAMIQAWDYIMAPVRENRSAFPELSPFIELRGAGLMWPPRTAPSE